ncbi:hypothetical protein OQH61_09055, partial [Helicobacter sp. MIT 21-1697]|uniref:hypothetical protein n=1 Tax=Helicobacter sp. MIT 21-1697 TaxID=2993733 RepID=UPI00224B4326
MSLKHKIRLFLRKLRKNRKYNKKYRSIIQSISRRNPIRVAFLVKYDSMFPAQKIFELMLEDSVFEPFIIVMPDTHRGEEHCF